MGTTDVIVRPSFEITDMDQAILKQGIASACNPAEFKTFLKYALHRGLDPLAGQVWPVIYNAKDAYKRKMVFITSIDGYRTLAESSGKFEGVSEGELFYEDKEGKKSKVPYSEFDPADCKRLISATISVYKTGDREPHKRTALFSRFKKEGPGSEVWQSIPEHMILKVAEAHALRAAFPTVLSNLYTTDEMSEANPPIDVQATVVETKKAEEPQKAELPSAEFQQTKEIEHGTQQEAQKEPAKVPVQRRTRRKADPNERRVAQDPSGESDPPHPADEPGDGEQQTVFGSDNGPKQQPAQPNFISEAVTVWEGFLKYCTEYNDGKQLPLRATNDALHMVKKRFTLGPNDGVAAIPPDSISDLRIYLKNTVFKALQDESWLPRQREE